MFIVPTDQTISALSHDGTEYTPDASGRFEVPVELGAALAGGSHWSVAEDQEPVKPARKASAKTAAKDN